MLNLTKMTRWVERRGRMVEFGNIVGPFCGKPYKYQCVTVAKAQQLESYLKGYDADGLPAGFPPEKQKEYGAVEL